MSEAFPPLTAFMPHRPPMLLLDRMLACTDAEAICDKTIRADDVFVTDGGISGLVALELFAQAAAAHFGYLGMKRGSGFASGALLGTRKLELAVHRLAVGDTVEVRVTQVMAMPPAAQYECALVREGETIASGTINVAMAMGGGPQGAEAG